VKTLPVYWVQNIQQHYIEPLNLTASYNPESYPAYDNYEAIEVSKTNDIPKDYYGLMGVPLRYIAKYNPQQFELIGLLNNSNLKEKNYMPYVPSVNSECINKDGIEVIWNGPIVNKQKKYIRIIIRRKQ